MLTDFLPLLSMDAETALKVEGLLYLVLHVVLSSFFLLIFRWIQRQPYDFYTVGAVNYIAGAGVAGLFILARGSFASGWAAGLCGAANGIFYFAAFFFLPFLLKFKGAALTAVVTRLSILLAVLLGIVVWEGWPTPAQTIGIALACVSLVLVGGRAVLADVPELPPRTFIVLVGFFLVAGGSRLAQEVFKHTAQTGQISAFIVIGFSLAAAASVVVLLKRQKMPTGPELLIGGVIGVTNVAQTAFVLKALEHFQGYIVFPLSSAGGLVFTTLVAVLLLKEQLTGLSYAGIGLAVASLALLQSGV